MTESQGHPLFAVNLETLEVLHLRSQAEAERKLGASNSKVNMVIKGKRNKTHGFWFTNADNSAVINAKDRLYKLIGNKINSLVAGDDSKKVAKFIAGLKLSN